MANKISDNKNKKVMENALGIDVNTKKISLFVSIVLGVVLVFSIILNIYELFYKKVECEVCEEPKEIIVTEQIINYNGYTFKIPEDWNFTTSSNEYKLSNNKKTLEIELTKDEITYDELLDDETLKNYLQELTIAKNIKITRNEEKSEEELKYYYIEGQKESYTYTRIMLIVNDGIINVDTIYEDQNTYNTLKNDVLKFALSYKKNNI